MAKYRQVHTTFWDDSFVIDLTPEEKYFYLYLMTNNNTTQCGIYELHYRVMEMQTGYNRDTVVKLLERFTNYGKILYHEPTKEIILLNWARYNFINSPKVKKCIEKELKSVKNQAFVRIYLESLKEYGYGIDTVSIDYGEEEEEEKEQEEEGEEKKAPSQTVSQPPMQPKKFDAVAEFQNNIRFNLNTYQIETLVAMEKEYDHELVAEAIRRTGLNNKTTPAYTDGILKSWHNNNIHTMIQLHEYEEQRNRKSNYQANNNPVTPPNYNYEVKPNGTLTSNQQCDDPLRNVQLFK